MAGKATPGRDARAAWIALGLVAAVLAIYAQSGSHEFLILDDDQYVTGNGYVRQGLTAGGLRWAFGTFAAANWHPLTWLSHMLDVELFGLDAGWHHLSSVALHALNSVLLFVALRMMTGSTWAPALVAALFAVHPLRVESVAWVSERKDVLAGLFWMTTLVAYAAYAKRPAAGRYLIVFLSLALGLMAKPMLVTLPFLLLLLDVWPLGRWKVRGVAVERSRFPSRPPVPLLVEKLPLLALAAGSSAVTVAAQGAGAAVSTADAVPFGMRLANAVASFGTYLWKTVVPLKLAYFYPHPAGATEVPATFWLAVGLSSLVLAAVTVLVIRDRGRPYLALGWLWLLGTLVPVIGLFQVGAQAMADRYTYLPSIGIYVAVAWLVAELTARQPGLLPIAKVAVPAALVVLALVAWRQAGTWRDSRTLFTHALEITRNNHVAHTHLGTLLNVAGDLDGAERHYQAALRIEPTYAEALSALGIVHGKRGDLAGAAEHFERAVAAAPQHPDGHYNLGLVLRAQGDLAGAETRFREAIRLRAGFDKAWSGLGQVAESRGDRAGALASYRRALEINPGNEHARAALERLGGG